MEKGSVKGTSRRMRGTDDFKIMEFVTEKCRGRAAMSPSLDSKVAKRLEWLDVTDVGKRTLHVVHKAIFKVIVSKEK